MFTGQVAEVSNREDWVSDFMQLIDEDDGSVLNILNPDIGFDCSVYIKDEDRWSGCYRAIATISNGQVVVTDSDVANEPGIQWTFPESQLRCLRAGTYQCGVKVTANGLVTDVVIGSLAILEGN